MDLGELVNHLSSATAAPDRGCPRKAEGCLSIEPNCGVSVLVSSPILCISNHFIAQLFIIFSIYFLYIHSFPTSGLIFKVFSYMLSRVSQLARQLNIMSPTNKTPDINLYTTQTPNGIKIAITLEELGFASLFSSKRPTHFIP